MKIKLTQIDAFTEKPFSGNPAAVCILEPDQDRELTDQQRQSIAEELNLAETAFVVPDSDQFRLRWFTPRVEVDLCGHATMAAAHALWSEGRVNWEDDISFQTRSGQLECRNGIRAAGERQVIELNFPRLEFQSIEPPTGLLDALEVVPIAVVKSHMDYLVHLADEAAVRRVEPDFRSLQKVDTRGVIVTAAASQSPESAGYDFVSRFFAPAAGIDEDHVTGSAHCLLGPYWESILGKQEFLAFQASQRGGEVHVRLEGDRVRLSGYAVTVINGELYL